MTLIHDYIPTVPETTLCSEHKTNKLALKLLTNEHRQIDAYFLELLNCGSLSVDVL